VWPLFSFLSPPLFGLPSESEDRVGTGRGRERGGRVSQGKAPYPRQHDLGARPRHPRTREADRHETADDKATINKLILARLRKAPSGTRYLPMVQCVVPDGQ